MNFDQIKSKIYYSPDWFAQRYPGFYSEACYEVLADYYNRKEEQVSEGSKGGQKRKIRTLEEESENCSIGGVEENKENVSPTEFLSSIPEHSGEFLREV